MSKTDVQIAEEVIGGKWGIGKEREEALRKAGYDYNTIQSFVNKIIESGKPIKEIEIECNKYCGVVINLRI